MQRTTTTATLLVTVAVTALTGCVTLQPPTAPGPVRTPVWPSAPRPEGKAEPQVVQAPAREALEMIEPSRTPLHRAPAAPVPAQRQPSHRTGPGPGPDHQDHRAPGTPRAKIPEVAGSLPDGAGKNTDVCALGRKYGGWRADSPESVICKETYGR